MSVVLDAGAVIAWLKGENGGDLLSDRLDIATKVDEPVFIHAINLCEVFYEYSRGADEQFAQAILGDVASQGIRTDESLDALLCADAGQIKADWRRVSLADCFGLALARRLGAEFLTTDRHELEPLLAAKVANIIFIR